MKEEILRDTSSLCGVKAGGRTWVQRGRSRSHTKGRCGDMSPQREQEEGMEQKGNMQRLVVIEIFIALCCRQTQNEFSPCEDRAV